MKYCIVTSDAGRQPGCPTDADPIDFLMQVVAYLIKDGWEPQGGVTCCWSRHSDRPEYAQALVHKDSNKEFPADVQAIHPFHSL